MAYRSCIETDIYNTIRSHEVDISGEIGRVLLSFVSYWRKRDKSEQREMPLEFLDVARGLQRYLTYKIGKTVSLDEMVKSCQELCGILRKKSGRELAELYKYLGDLRDGEPKERVWRLSPRVPKEWLNRNSVN